MGALLASRWEQICPWYQNRVSDRSSSKPPLTHETTAWRNFLSRMKIDALHCSMISNIKDLTRPRRRKLWLGLDVWFNPRLYQEIPKGWIELPDQLKSHGVPRYGHLRLRDDAERIYRQVLRPVYLADEQLWISSARGLSHHTFALVYGHGY